MMGLKESLVKGLGKVKVMSDQNSPEILTGLTVIGLVTTGIMAYKAGLKAYKIIEEYRKDMKDTAPKDLEAKKAVKKEAAKKLVPVIAAPVVMGAITTTCAISSNRISNKRIAVLSAAYTLSESALKDLNNKMTEVLGEKKTRSIKDAIVKDKVQNDPIEKINSPIITNGNVLCKDRFAPDYFYADAQKIGEAINILSARARSEMEVNLNDFYELLGLPRTDVGDYFGFTADDALNGNLPMAISAQLTADNRPCLYIDYEPTMIGYHRGY